jgi:hypothetical protein
MSLLVQRSKLTTALQGDLNPGEVVFLQGADAGLAVVCRHAEEQYATRFVLRMRASMILLTNFTDVMHSSDIARTGASDAQLRLRPISASEPPKSGVDAIGLLGVDRAGPFLIATKQLERPFPVAVDLLDWRRESERQGQEGSRFASCFAWFSSWELVHVDEWGNETTVLAAPSPLPASARP